MRRVLALAVAGIALLPAVAGAEAPTCLTLAADDGHEPICNPWLWESTWEQGHRNPYSQHTTPIAGPRSGEPTTVQRVTLPQSPLGVTLGAFFGPRYPNGKRVAWALSVVGVNDTPIYKVDMDSGRVLTTYTHLASGEGTPSERAALSGIYVISDRHGHLIQPRSDRIEVFGDRRPGAYDSPITSLHSFVLPPRARCGAGDRLVGLTMRWDGRIGFVTTRGVVGVIPSEIAQMSDRNLIVHSINPSSECARADRSLTGLETVSNSISGDEDGGMYPVTNRAQYRFDVRGGEVRRTWRTPYKTGTNSSVRQDDGSGSTPALMGTDPDDDKFVVITDGQALTHMVLMRRDTGAVACEVPLNFGDEALTEAQNEQSVAVRGYAAIIPNNEVRNLGALDPAVGAIALLSGLPLQLAVAGVTGGLPPFQPYGVERVDWDPRSRSCKVRWVNKTVSIPNGVPTVSAGASQVYGWGARSGVWGLEGLNFETGKSEVWVPVDAHPFTNSFFSALSIAPDGSVWSGALAGLSIVRPPARPEPARVCKEFEPPSGVISRLRVSGRRLRANGMAADAGCADVRRVELAVEHRDGRRCRFATGRGLTARRSCSRVHWLRVSGTRRWTKSLSGLRRGRYRVRLRVVDRVGNRGSGRGRSVSVRR